MNIFNDLEGSVITLFKTKAASQNDKSQAGVTCLLDGAANKRLRTIEGRF